MFGSSTHKFFTVTIVAAEGFAQRLQCELVHPSWVGGREIVVTGFLDVAGRRVNRVQIFATLHGLPSG